MQIIDIPLHRSRGVAANVLELIGRTPIVRLGRLTEGMSAEVFAKLEMFNPASSVKDRVALAMIEDAEARGMISPGKTTIVEATSGNTGIGLALVALVKGYSCIIVMPDSMSMERRTMIRAFGAQVVLSNGTEGFPGTIRLAEKLLSEIPESWSPIQFNNMANPEIHRLSTGAEIWEDMAGAVDVFVCGIGTGGTLTGVGQYLKEQNPGVRIVAVEPAKCALLSGGDPGLHGIQGLNGGFIAETTRRDIIDDVLVVSDEAAIETARALARQEGLFVGISSGASAWGALEMAKRPSCRGKKIVTLLPDSGERYFSTKLWSTV